MFTILTSLFLIIVAAMFAYSGILVSMLSERKINILTKQKNLSKKEYERIFDPKFPF